jgi:serine/threonine protein kinase
VAQNQWQQVERKQLPPLNRSLRNLLAPIPTVDVRQMRKSFSSPSGPFYATASASSGSSHSADKKLRQDATAGGAIVRNIPAFHIDEIIRGDRLNWNWTFEIYEIRGIQQNHEEKDPMRQLPRDLLADQINSKRYRRDTGCLPLSRLYVLKHIRKERMDSQAGFEEAALALENEANMMQGLNHPNIAKLRGFSIGGTEAYYLRGKHDSYFLIVEQMEETLGRRLERWRSKESFLRLRTLFGLLRGRVAAQNFLIKRLQVAFDISDGLQYIHGHGICHRNLTLTSIGFNFHQQVQIMEFGTACQHKRTYRNATESGIILPGRKRDDSGAFRINMNPSHISESGFQKDILDFSRIICEILTMRSCGPSLSEREENAYIRSFLALASVVPRRLLGMLQLGLSDNADSRPTITEFYEYLSDLMYSLLDESSSSSSDPRCSIHRQGRRPTELGLIVEGDELLGLFREEEEKEKTADYGFVSILRTGSWWTSLTGGHQVT